MFNLLTPSSANKNTIIRENIFKEALDRDILRNSELKHIFVWSAHLENVQAAAKLLTKVCDFKDHQGHGLCISDSTLTWHTSPSKNHLP